MPAPAPLDAIPAAIRFAAEPLQAEARAVLARQGQAPRHMYWVAAGEVRLERAGRDGEAIVLQRVQRGWVAEASLLAPRYHCDLVCGPATSLLRVPVRVIRAALASSPEFAFEWIAGLSAEVRRLRGVRERVGLRSAEQRIVHAIETDGQDGVLQPAGTLKSWAAELGLSHEALYRTLARMEAAGRLRRQGGSLALPRRVRAWQAARRSR